MKWMLPMSVALVAVLAALLVQAQHVAPASVERRQVTVPSGERDWAGRGRLARLPSGRWLYAYIHGSHHNDRCEVKEVRLIASDDEGRTWSWPRTVIESAPDERHAEVGLVRCGGALLMLTHVRDSGRGWVGTDVRRSEDGGATWTYERRMWPGARYALDYCTLPNGNALVAVMGAVDDRGLVPVDVWTTSDGSAWSRRGALATAEDGVNEVGLAMWRGDVVAVCRTADEARTLLRRSGDGGATWGRWRDISGQVGVVQQPRLRTAAEMGASGRDGRLYLFGRRRYTEYEQRNAVYWSDDGGRTWTGLDLDGAHHVDTGYADGLLRAGGALVVLAYRGTDAAADVWQYVTPAD